MKFNWPEAYLSEKEWHIYVQANVSALAQLWDAGKYEQYGTMLSLYQLTYEDFKEYCWNQGNFYAPYIPIIRKAMPKMVADDIVGVQPMSESTGEIFKFKSKEIN